VGGAIGSAIIASIIASQILPSGLPTENAYVVAFAILAASVGLSGVAAAIGVHRRQAGGRTSLRRGPVGEAIGSDALGASAAVGGPQ
jgi:hypothetical protein